MCKDSIAHVNEALCCALCLKFYDLVCANINEKKFRLLSADNKKNWRCHICIAQKDKSGAAGCSPCQKTPSKSQKLVCNSPLSTPFDMNVTQRTKKSRLLEKETDDEVLTTSNLRQIIREELGGVVEEMVSVQLKKVEELVTGFQDSLSFFNARYDEVRTCLDEKAKTINILEKENEILRSSVRDMGVRLNQMEQRARSCNIEIQCVPEHRSENILKVIQQLGETVNVKINEANVLHCTRISKKQANSNRPRSILVQLPSPRARDTILAAVIKYNKSHPQDKLHSGHLGIAADPPQPIFVVEHLSSENKSIHAATRKRAKELEYKFVWVRNGRIFVRKDDASEAIFINNLEKLNSLK